jgi:hypothetical protein
MLALLICRANEDGQIVSPSQSAFIPGRNIMEGVVVLHEMIHEIYRKKMNGVILKIDFKKVYDKVNYNNG